MGQGHCLGEDGPKICPTGHHFVMWRAPHLKEYKARLFKKSASFRKGPSFLFWPVTPRFPAKILVTLSSGYLPPRYGLVHWVQQSVDDTTVGHVNRWAPMEPFCFACFFKKFHHNRISCYQDRADECVGILKKVGVLFPIFNKLCSANFAKLSC